MKRTSRLKALIEAPEILIMPGVYDAFSAKLAERAGAKAVQVSGFGLAASHLGLPDVGILTESQMAELTRCICRAVEIPVMADGDTGFGNAVNVYYTVRDFEDAGAAGINLEDQVFPKRCGHMDGKQIIPLSEAVGKIEAAAAARRDPDFVINARTDAIAVAGVEEAIRRGNAYARAGADLIFVEAPQKADDIKRVIQSIEAPVSINLLHGGKSPAMTIRQLEEWGAARVSLPVAALAAAARALERTYRHILEQGEIASLQEDSFSFKELTALLGLEGVRELEQRFSGNDFGNQKEGEN